MKKLFAVLVLIPALTLAQGMYTRWSVQHSPAAATQATISKAAVPGMRHVATGVTVCITATAAQARLLFNLRDGATGAGTILWSVSLGSPTVGTSVCIVTPIPDLVGSTNTAMTLESAAAPAATNFAQVTLMGYDTY